MLACRPRPARLSAFVFVRFACSRRSCCCRWRTAARPPARRQRQRWHVGRRAATSGARQRHAGARAAARARGGSAGAAARRGAAGSAAAAAARRAAAAAPDAADGRRDGGQRGRRRQRTAGTGGATARHAAAARAPPARPAARRHRGGATAGTGGAAATGTGGTSSRRPAAPGRRARPAGGANFPFPQHRASSNCIYPPTCSDADMMAGWAAYKTALIVADGTDGSMRVTAAQRRQRHRLGGDLVRDAVRRLHERQDDVRRALEVRAEAPQHARADELAHQLQRHHGGRRTRRPTPTRTWRSRW